jgi:phosphoheptose isomerase
MEVLRRVREAGYAGGKSALYGLVASLRPKEVKPLVRFEGLPPAMDIFDARVVHGVAARKRRPNGSWVGREWAEVLRGGHRAVLGNGGSAADAQHMAAELVGRYLRERPGLPVLALTVNTSSLTAIANDYSYDAVFARQLEALGSAGDMAIGISTSGNSRNVLLAIEAAKRKGMTSVGLTGQEKAGN